MLHGGDKKPGQRAQLRQESLQKARHGCAQSHRDSNLKVWPHCPEEACGEGDMRGKGLEEERRGVGRRDGEPLGTRGRTFFPGRTRRSATSAAVLAAASRSAALPSTGALGSSPATTVCATTAMKPSMWHPKSLRPENPAPSGQRREMLAARSPSAPMWRPTPLRPANPTTGRQPGRGLQVLLLQEWLLTLLLQQDTTVMCSTVCTLHHIHHKALVRHMSYFMCTVASVSTLPIVH